MRNKTLYAVIHRHEYGAGFYLVRCAHVPKKEEVIQHLDIDIADTLDEEEIIIEEIISKEAVEIPEPDGTEGQDRKSYTDTQDRKNYY